MYVKSVNDGSVEVKRTRMTVEMIILGSVEWIQRDLLKSVNVYGRQDRHYNRRKKKERMWSRFDSDLVIDLTTDKGPVIYPLYLSGLY